MIDVLKEIQMYKLIDIANKAEHTTENYNDELTETLTIFNKSFDKLGKEQYKVANKLEDILEILEEEKGKEEDNKELKEKNKAKEEETRLLLKTLIDMSDMLEDIYIFSKRSGQDSLKEQMQLQWEQMGYKLAQRGITRIESTNASFDVQLHIAKEIKSLAEINNGQIVEVLKSGYLYKGAILRKSEVVVNKN